ncbi:sulfoxide reductase heme-binding subunit YedZ [bacterium]|nr:sulfoxide reductase heme-binding subunit YedZ [bacterium]
MKTIILRRFDVPAVNLVCAIPALILIDLYIGGMLGPNPVQILERRSGDIALVLLLISLTFTPLRVVTGFTRGIKYRRITGLWAFYYAALHFMIFLGLDYGFDFSLAFQAIVAGRYIWYGAAALLILTSMAITSTNGWKVRLKRNWKRIHSFVYLASLLAALHFAFAKKGDLFHLRGEELLPLIALIIWAILMLLRLPPIRSLVSRHK